jgi:hypothetical protein
MRSNLDNRLGRSTSNYDASLLFVTRFTRLFAYGAVSVVLVFYLTGTIGLISLTGNEVGPFLPIEQAALTQVVSAATRTARRDWIDVPFIIAGIQKLLMICCSIDSS